MTDHKYKILIGAGKTGMELISLLLLLAPLCAASTNSETPRPRVNAALRVHLPREVAVKDKDVTLGGGAIVRGEEAVVTKASAIPLGRISVADQKITVDRPMVLSRLACNGIPASKVTLTGADKVTVGWRRQVIEGEKFVEVAGSFLKQSSPTFSFDGFEPVRVPEHFAVSASIGDIEFAPHLVEAAPVDKATVGVALIADGNQLGMREVTFQLRYRARRALASTNIDSGSIISAENVKIEETVSDEPEPADWRAPYGLVARRRIAAGTVIASNMVTPVKPEVVLKRNQTVLIRIERPGLLVTAIGRAMQDGCTGEYIKVRNVDSKRVILARVRQDATVEPLI